MTTDTTTRHGEEVAVNVHYPEKRARVEDMQYVEDCREYDSLAAKVVWRKSFERVNRVFRGSWNWWRMNRCGRSV